MIDKVHDIKNGLKIKFLSCYMKYTTPYFCTNVNNVRTPLFQILVRMFCKNVFFFLKNACAAYPMPVHP